MSSWLSEHRASGFENWGFPASRDHWRNSMESEMEAEFTAKDQRHCTPSNLLRPPDSTIEGRASWIYKRIDVSKNVGLRFFTAVTVDLGCDSARPPAVSRSCAVFVSWFMHGRQLRSLALRRFRLRSMVLSCHFKILCCVCLVFMHGTAPTTCSATYQAQVHDALLKSWLSLLKLLVWTQDCIDWVLCAGEKLLWIIRLGPVQGTGVTLHSQSHSHRSPNGEQTWGRLLVENLVGSLQSGS